MPANKSSRKTGGVSRKRIGAWEWYVHLKFQNNYFFQLYTKHSINRNDGLWDHGIYIIKVMETTHEFLNSTTSALFLCLHGHAAALFNKARCRRVTWGWWTQSRSGRIPTDCKKTQLFIDDFIKNQFLSTTWMFFVKENKPQWTLFFQTLYKKSYEIKNKLKVLVVFCSPIFFLLLFIFNGEWDISPLKEATPFWIFAGKVGPAWIIFLICWRVATPAPYSHTSAYSHCSYNSRELCGLQPSCRLPHYPGAWRDCTCPHLLWGVEVIYVDVLNECFQVPCRDIIPSFFPYHVRVVINQWLWWQRL